MDQKNNSSQQPSDAAAPSAFVARDRSQAVAAGRKLWVAQDDVSAPSTFSQSRHNRKPFERRNPPNYRRPQTVNVSDGRKSSGISDDFDGSSPSPRPFRENGEASQLSASPVHVAANIDAAGEPKDGFGRTAAQRPRYPSGQRHGFSQPSTAPMLLTKPSVAERKATENDIYNASSSAPISKTEFQSEQPHSVAESDAADKHPDQTLRLQPSNARPAGSAPQSSSSASSQKPQNPFDLKTASKTDIIRQLFPDASKSRAISTPIKLLDEQMRIQTEQISKIMSDFPSCFIVGVLGRSGVGKSTVLSHLGLPIPSASESDSTATRGIDLYVTPQRVVLLDTQAILSPVSADHIRKVSDLFGDLAMHGIGGNSASAQQHQDLLAEIESIKITMFLMSVCHVIILVSNHPRDTSLWKHVRKVESIRAKLFQIPKRAQSAKMPVSASHLSSSYRRSESMIGSPQSEEASHHNSKSASLHASQSSQQYIPPPSSETYHPQIVYVASKCKPDMLSPQFFSGLIKSFSSVFKDSDLNAFGLFHDSCLYRHAQQYSAARSHRDLDGSVDGDSDNVDPSASVETTIQLPNANILCLPLAPTDKPTNPKLDLTKPIGDVLLSAGIDLSLGSMPASYESLAQYLCHSILEVPRYPVHSVDSHATTPSASQTPTHNIHRSVSSRRQYLVSERDWVRSSARIWDALRQLDIPHEYLHHIAASGSNKYNKDTFKPRAGDRRDRYGNG